jgi:hypothetical protein
MILVQTGSPSPVWLWLDRGGTLLSYVALGTVIAAGFQWWQSVRRQERRRIRGEALAAGRAAKPVALVVSASGGSMEADVEGYLSQQFAGWSFPHLPVGAGDPDPSPRRWPIVGFEHAETLTPDGIEAELARLRAVERWLKEEGFNEVHLFMRTPVAFGSAVGCIFTNWGAVHVYHWNHPERTYEYWFALGDVKRVLLLPTLGDAISAAVARRLQRTAPGEATPLVGNSPTPLDSLEQAGA